MTVALWPVACNINMIEIVTNDVNDTSGVVLYGPKVIPQFGVSF